MRDIFKVAIVLAATVLVAPAQAADVMQTKARAIARTSRWIPPGRKCRRNGSSATPRASHSMRRTMLMSYTARAL